MFIKQIINLKAKNTKKSENSKFSTYVSKKAVLSLTKNQAILSLKK